MTFAASVRPNSCCALPQAAEFRLPPSMVVWCGHLYQPGQGLECPRSLRPLTPEGSHTCMACKYSAHTSHLGPSRDTGLAV